MIKKKPTIDILYKYDNSKKLIEARNVNNKGELVEDIEGVSIYRWMYDYHGNKVEEGRFGLDEKLKDKGVAYVRWRYDWDNNKIEQSYYGKSKNLVEYCGVAITKYKYDDDKNMIEVSYYGSDNKLRRNGEAIYCYRYNKRKIIEIKKYGGNNKLISVQYFNNSSKFY